MAVLLRDLSDAYLFFTQKINLPIYASFHYKDYVAQQNAIVQYHAENDAQFWKNYLRDTGLFILPKRYIVRKHPHTPIQIPLSELFVSKLHQFCNTHHVGLNDVLSAATTLALFQCCDYEMNCVPHKLLVSILKSTREELHHDHAIGCFLRMSLIKMELHTQVSLLELAKQAQKSAEETEHYQRSASLVKIAALGKLPSFKDFGMGLLIKSALTIIAKCFPSLYLNSSLIEACKTLAIAERGQQFFININILNNFLTNVNTHTSTVLGLPQHPIPLYSYPLHVMKSAIDIAFHRSNDYHLPFMTIATNLTFSFQKQFSAALTSIIETGI